MEQTQIDTEKAGEIVKKHLEKMKGADIELAGRKLIDWLGFREISARQKDDYFEVICDILENLYSQKREKYTFLVSKEGKILEVLQNELP